MFSLHTHTHTNIHIYTHKVVIMRGDRIVK